VAFNRRYFPIIRKKTCGPRNAIFSNFIFKEFKSFMGFIVLIMEDI
jgi:hypothetical protein